MADKIQFRRDTAARWTQFNPILSEGEMGLITDNPNMYKIGDGVTAWNSLALRGYTGTISQIMGRDENAVVSEKVIASLVTFNKNDAGKHALSILNGKDLLIVDYKNTPWAWQGGYISKDGVYVNGDITGYAVTDMIAVEEGEIIKIGKTNCSGNVLKVAAYDSDGNILLDKSVAGSDSGSNPPDYTYVVPSGVYQVRFTNQMSQIPNPRIWSLSSFGSGIGFIETYRNDKQSQDAWNEKNALSNLMGNLFSKDEVIEQYIVESPSGTIVPWATTFGTSAVSGFIPIPTGATQIYLFTDQVSTAPFMWMNCILKNDTDLNSAGQLVIIRSDGNAYNIPEAYRDQFKYVVLTIARFNGQYPVDIDYSNIAIGFDALFRVDGISERYIQQSVVNIMTPKLKFLSEDFQNFRRFKDSSEDLVARYKSKGTDYNDVLVSNYYKAILSLYVTGLSKNRTYRLGMLRRGQYASDAYDYSIIIHAWDDTNQFWVRAAYWQFTNVDVEANNPNGVNLLKATTIGMDGLPATIEALIDYSFIPDNSSSWLNPTHEQQGVQNFILKDECFEGISNPKLHKSDVFNESGNYYDSKMDFMSSGKNKFDGEPIIGWYTNSDTGQKYQYGAGFAAISKDIEVPDGATHVATQGFLTNSSYTYPSLVCCMDANKNVIGGSSMSDFIAPLLAGTKYIAVPLARNVDAVPDPDWSDTMIEFSNVHTAYAPFKIVIDPDYLEMSAQELVNRIIAVGERIDNMELEPFKMTDMIMNLPSKSEVTKEGYVFVDDTDVNDKILKLK